jgi:hypothetical protein
MEYSHCDDGNVYGVTCNGVSCECLLNGVSEGRFVTPHCAEQLESTLRCGWPLSHEVHSGTGEVEGGPCLPTDVPAAGCECSEGGAWNCLGTSNECALSAHWQGSSESHASVSVAFDAAGQIAITSNDSSTALLGTWQRNGSDVAMRTEGSADIASCLDGVGRYTLAWSTDCGQLSLGLTEDTCVERRGLLGGFVGVAEPR